MYIRQEFISEPEQSFPYIILYYIENEWNN